MVFVLAPQVGKACALSGKASLPSFKGMELRKPCAATTAHAARSGEAHFMVRCEACSGGGRWYCVQCLAKFARAILEHGGFVGRRRPRTRSDS